jgi:transcriptional regulator with XRE-family HTH domain
VSGSQQVGIEQQRAVYEFLARPLLSQLCILHRISVRDFAEIFDISKSYAEEILNHKKFPQLELGVRIARYWECTVEELLGWRVDDNGSRRPLLVALPGGRGLIRLSSTEPMDSALAIVKRVADEIDLFRKLDVDYE